jgi:hypothetical protein
VTEDADRPEPHGLSAIPGWVERKRADDRFRMAFAALFGIIGVGLAALWAARGGLPYLLAMTIGGFVGLVEIAGRYRYAPTQAVSSFSGAVYIALNLGASAAAYYLIGIFEVVKKSTEASTPRSEVEAVLLAGFGALVFLRSSLFKVKVGDADVGVGPAAILDTLLLVADRGVDRRQAVARAQDVSALVARIKNPTTVANMLAKYSLALMQNVDDKTVSEVGKAVNEVLADESIPAAVKMDIVALRLGVVVGADVLEAAVQALGDRLNAPMGPIITPPNPTIRPTAPDADPGAGVATAAAELKSELVAAGVAAKAPDHPKQD